MIPEQRLWRAVVGLACEDLFFLPKVKDEKVLKQAQEIRRSAFNFLFSGIPFYKNYRKFVFESAGIDTDVNMKDLKSRAVEFEARHA